MTPEETQRKIESLEAKIKEQEAIIAKKEEESAIQAENFRKMRTSFESKYKTLEEMTKEEREQMTEAQIQFKKDQDALHARQEEFEKRAREIRNAELNAAKEKAIKDYAGDNEELKKKIEFHMSEFGGDVMTADQMIDRVNKAFILTGEKKPDPILEAHNNRGGNENAQIDPKRPISEEQQQMIGAMPTLGALLSDNK